MCNTCDTCVLISNPCFCKFSGLNGVLLEDAMSSIIHANIEISDCVSEDCFDKICSDEEDDLEMSEAVKNNLHFKIFYSLLIKKDWLLENGDGQISKQGLIKKTGDDISEFEVCGSKSIDRRVERIDQKINIHRKKFIDWFVENFPECSKCSKSTDCGCGCQSEKYQNSYESNCCTSNNCGCGKCDSGLQDKIGDWVAL